MQKLCPERLEGPSPKSLGTAQTISAGLCMINNYSKLCLLAKRSEACDRFFK